MSAFAPGIRIDGLDGKPLGEDADSEPLDDLAIHGDEIVGVRIERTGTADCWARIYLKNKPDVVLWFTSRGKLTAKVTRD